MSKTIDPAEIRNPRLTLERREREAGLKEERPAPGLRGDNGQLMFTRPVPTDPEKKRRQDKQFEEIMRRRREADRKREQEFETSFREGSDDPLTDAVVAARRAAKRPMREEDAAYRDAYEESNRAA